MFRNLIKHSINSRLGDGKRFTWVLPKHSVHRKHLRLLGLRDRIGGKLPNRKHRVHRKHLDRNPDSARCFQQTGVLPMHGGGVGTFLLSDLALRMTNW